MLESGIVTIFILTTLKNIMRTLLIVMILIVAACQLHALDLPEGASKSVLKSEQVYQRDIDKVATGLRKKIDKNLAKFIKSYNKIKKSMKNKGQITGLKSVILRIQNLDGTQEVDLFGDVIDDIQEVALHDLPQSAQRLEQAYELSVNQLLESHLVDILDAQNDYIKSLQKECKRLVKKEFIDKAEVLQEYIDNLAQQKYSTTLVPIGQYARCLGVINISQLGTSRAWAHIDTIMNNVVFVWHNAATTNVIRNNKGKALIACNLRARGRSYIDRGYVMRIREGAFLAEEKIGKAILQACKNAQQLSIEAVIRTDHHDQDGPARIISFSRDSGQRNFTIGQDGDHLILRLRTPRTGINGSHPQIDLGEIEAKQDTHLLLSYKPGQLTWWINGIRASSDEVTGDFSNWDDQQFLLFGDEYTDNRQWAGRLSGVLIRSAVTNEAAAQAAYTRFKEAQTLKKSVERLHVEAKLIAAPHIPDPKTILPLRQALVADVYEKENGEQFEILHWAILDGKNENREGREIGESYDYAVESFSDHPELFDVKLFTDNKQSLPRYVELSPAYD